MGKLNCYSQYEFDELCKASGWSSTNIPENSAFISIIGTLSCMKYYLGEIYQHWFKDAPEDLVCNLEFDDISKDEIIWKGFSIKGMSQEQADLLCEFIEKNAGKDFYIHCLAGQSRSQAVVRYILDTYPHLYSESDTRPENPCFTPNIDVVSKLKRAYRKMKYGDEIS